MDFNNLPPFYVGQKVICINANYNPMLVKGQQYTVLGVRQCATCKKWHLGFTPSTSGKLHWTCCPPGEKTLGYITAYASRFAPIQEKFESITYEKVIEKELIGVN